MPTFVQFEITILSVRLVRKQTINCNWASVLEGRNQPAIPIALFEFFLLNTLEHLTNEGFYTKNHTHNLKMKKKYSYLKI